MKLLTFAIIFIFLSAFLIISNGNLALKDSDSRLTFARAYYSWFLGLFGNFKTISGNVIDVDWIPKLENYSNLTR